MITHRAAFAAVALTALITASFTAAAVSYFGAVTAVAARSELSGNPGSAIVVTAPVAADQIRPASALVAATIHGPAPSLRATIAVSLQSGILKVPGAATSTQLISLPGLAGQIVVLRGTCRGGATNPIPACVPETAARVLGVTAGDQLTLRDTESGATVRVLITGIFRAVRPDSAYWMLDSMGAGAVQRFNGSIAAGPLVTSRAAAGGHFVIRSATWLGLPDFSALGTGGLLAIGSGLATRINSLPSSAVMAGANVTTNLPDELATLATALVVARTQLLAGLLTLLVVAGAALSLAVRLLAQRREPETALLGARGASRIQLARRGLLDAAIIAVPAAAAGPLLGVGLARLLIGVSSAATAAAGSAATAAAGSVAGSAATSVAGSVAGSVPGPMPGATGIVWLASLSVAAGCVAIIALPWLRRPPSPLRRRASSGRQRSVTAAVYARADLAVVAAAGGAAWQLIRSTGPISAGLDGTLSADPVLVVAPVLTLVAGALLTLRILPLAARLGDRVAARGRGLIVPVAAWQISRRTLRQAGPTLVTVLAVAAAVMAVAQRDSWQQSVRAQASFRVGADTRITLPPAGPLPLGQVTTVTAAPGVTASTPAVRSSFGLPNGGQATLLALDTRAAAAVIPAQAAGPSPAVLDRLAAAVPPVGATVPGRPTVLKLTARLGRGSVGQPGLFVQLTDAAGIGYLLRAGDVPADGRPHTLAVTVAAGPHADYPLRVTGFSLQFTTSVTPAPADTLTITGGLALAHAGSTSGRAFDLAVHGLPLITAVNQNPGSTAPSVVLARATAGGGIVAVFKPGFAVGAPSSPAGISLSGSYPGVGKPLPAVVTGSFLTATGLQVGDRFDAAMDGTTVQLIPVAVVSFLPTITDGSPSVLVDQRALVDALQSTGAPPEDATEWWLRTSGHLSLTGLPPGTSTASLAPLARVLLADPLSLASQQALLAIAIAVLLLAVIGLLVSIATAADRARDMALLDALGMPPVQVARLLGLEQALTAVATSGIGLLFGAALSKLIIPAVTLTAQAARPIPPIVVQVPWLLAAAVALAIAAVPTVAATLAVPRRGSGLARSRLEVDA